MQQTLSKHATLFRHAGGDRWTLQPAATQLHGKGKCSSPRHRKENQPSNAAEAAAEEDEESSIDLLGEYHDDDALDAPLPHSHLLPSHPLELRDEDISNVDDSDIEIPDYMEDDDLDLLADSQSLLQESQSLHSELDDYALSAAPSPRKRPRIDAKAPGSPLTSSSTFKEVPFIPLPSSPSPRHLPPSLLLTLFAGAPNTAHGIAERPASGHAADNETRADPVAPRLAQDP